MNRRDIFSTNNSDRVPPRGLWVVRGLLLVAFFALTLAAAVQFQLGVPAWGAMSVMALAAAWFGGRALSQNLFSPGIAMPTPEALPAPLSAQPHPEKPVPPHATPAEAPDFRKLIEVSPDGHVILDDGRISFINAAGTKILGILGTVAPVGVQMEDILPETQRDTFRQQLQSLAQSSAGWNVREYRFPRSDTEAVYVEIRCNHCSFEEKPAIHVVLRDVTEQKKMAEALSARNRELTIFQSVGMAITSRLDLRYVLNTVAQEMTRLFDVGQCTIFEWRPEDDAIVQNAAFGPEGWWDSRGEPEIDPLSEYPLMKSVLEEQIPEQMTISQIGTDPRERANMMRVGAKSRLLLPMIYQRQALGLMRLEDFSRERVFSYQEISLAKLLASQAASAIENARLFEQARAEIAVRLRAEMELQEERAQLARRVQERTMELSKANAELARAARLKDEFLASMSHELRTPLNTILGSAEILQSEVFGELAEQQQKYVVNIDESGRHLLSLINDILDLSKIEAGKMEISIGPVSVQAVSQASLRMVKQLAHKKHLKLKSDFQNTVSTFPADDRRVKQILVNLLSNAIKFTPDGGEVGLTVTDDVAQEVIRFTVWDSGIGIAQEDMARLFEPFVQLDSRLARQHTGTGLGLSLVSKMMELHGGGVSVESVVGQGSRFTVSFPLATTSEPLAQLEAHPEVAKLIKPAETNPDEMPLVLLAEDNEQSIGLFTDYLKLSGYRISVARTGVEALKRAKEDNPDIILMDIQMPEMDGLEAMRRLRAESEFSAVPIIAMTALAMPGDRERCLEAGASEYLSKPVNLGMMVETIHRFSGQS